MDLDATNASATGQSLFLLNPRLVSLDSTLQDSFAATPNVITLDGSKASGAFQSLTPLGGFGSANLTFDPNTAVVGNAIDVGQNNNLVTGEPVVYARSGGASLTITATGDDNALASSRAGTGGVVAGSAAQATTNDNTTTQAYIADDTNPSAAYTGMQISALNISAAHEAEFDSKTDTLQASALGFSGSWANDNDNSNTYATIGAGAQITAQNTTVSAVNTTRKDLVAPTTMLPRARVVWSKDAAANPKPTSPIARMTVGDSATIDVTGSSQVSGQFLLNAYNDVQGQITAKLDSGGLILLPGVTSPYEHQRR